MKKISIVQVGGKLSQAGHSGNFRAIDFIAKSLTYEVLDMEGNLCWNAWRYSSLEKALEDHPKAKY